MNAELILSRLRRFLLIVSGLLMLGTVGELIFIEHTQEPTQWIPFGLCGLGLVVVLAALFRPRRFVLLALRASMGMVALGSGFGIYEHLAGNLAFQLEVRPNASVLETLFAMLGGAAPLLAPGVLALTAVLAIAATYYHPTLDS